MTTKRPPGSPAISTPPLVSSALLSKVFDNNNSCSSQYTVFKGLRPHKGLKNDGTEPEKPLSWRDYALLVDKYERNQQFYKVQASCASQVSLQDRLALGSSKPLSAPCDYVLCHYCQRSVLSVTFASHLKNDCQSARQELAQGDVDTLVEEALLSQSNHNNSKNNNNNYILDTRGDTSTSVVGSRAPLATSEAKKKGLRANGELSGLKDTKSQGGTKRKAEYANGDTLEDTPSGAVNTITTNGTIANGNGSTDTLVDTTSDAKPQLKKKKKEKTKVKTIPKSKLPVDVEKQCGVPLPNGLLCARSLTCKTHSMGAKRAVTGRSAPYDVLLANYQKRNQIKQALLSTELQLANENEQFKDSVPLSPEEEFLQVMQGVKQSIPVPVERQIIMPARLRHGFFRMREMFSGAFLPKVSSAPMGLVGAGSGVVGGVSGMGNVSSRSLAFNVDDPSNLHFLKPASLSRAQAMQQVTMKQREQHLRMLQQQQPQ